MHAIAAAKPVSLDASDESLVLLARQGDEPAIRTLVQRYNRRLYRVARAVLRDDAEAEDVVQETHMRAFGNLDSFRGESGFSTWLTRITLNVALGRMRRRRPTVGLESIENRSEDESRVIIFPSGSTMLNPEQSTARLQARELLERAVEDLPEPFRIVFILRDVEDMSVEEAADHLSLKPATVKTRLHRARKLLRAGLEQRIAASLPDLLPFAGARCERIADEVVEMVRRKHGKAG